MIICGRGQGRSQVGGGGNFLLPPPPGNSGYAYGRGLKVVVVQNGNSHFRVFFRIFFLLVDYLLK